MKKIMLFAAACAALAACSKEIDTTTPEIGNGTAFEQGQTVTLTVNTGDQTKVTSELVTSGADKDKVNFAWETGDKIKVTVGTESAEFTLSSGAGTASAEFTGTMPAAGNTFNVQYPVTDPDLSSQTYVANALPKDKMKMAATGCALGSPFTLTPQYAALRLNLYGLNREVSSIVVTNITAEPNVSYTLNCSSAVRVGKSEETATPFLLVVPVGASEWEFKVEVTAGNATANPDPVPTYAEGSYTGDGIVITTGIFTTSSAKTFTAAQILNMPAKLISAVWAPVSCGYDATNYPMGLLYQWGRQYGQAHETGIITPTSMSKSDDTEGNKEKFGLYNDTDYNWFSGGIDNTLWNGGTKGAKDPCPEGWRVPTESELEALMGSHTEGDFQDGSGIYSGMKGKYFDGSSAAVPTSGLFLPAAGCRYFENGGAYDRGYYGNYRSSSVNGIYARLLSFSDSAADIHNASRADGYSVRCVQE